MTLFPTQFALRCAVSIATHNRLAELRATCEAVVALDPAPDEVWVVADGCTDGTVAFLKEKFPSFRVIEHAESQGHVRSRDEIVRRTDCDLVLVLDDDSHPAQKDCIERLRQLFAWRPQLAVASLPQQTDEFPETLECDDFGPPAFVGNYSNASAVLQRSVYLELGGYDLDFYHAYDEVDYALRVIAAGYEIYRPAHIVIRHRFSSLNRNEIRMHHLHSRYEQASVWRRCPWPQSLAVSLFRALRQAQYAARRGWLTREPEWWSTALADRKRNREKRRPVSWPAYRGWMRLMRRPVRGEAQWEALRADMALPPAEADRLEWPRISISATNPCHLYSMARVLARENALGTYYSGYPRWKLPGSELAPVRTHSFRTLAVYGALKFLPPLMRPRSTRMFRWQDEAFDRWVSRHLEPVDFLHAMPGQCLESFRVAREHGVRTVLNHATGPATSVRRLLKAEYERAGLNVNEVASLDEEAQQLRKQEIALADYHCVASTLVRDQLIAEEGVSADRIWVVPYGADQDIFYPRHSDGPSDFRIIYAGQYTLRKGLRFLLEALSEVARNDWRLDCYGPTIDGSIPDGAGIKPSCPVRYHGAIATEQLARRFRESSVLVLPSLEEGFGLVVVQALNCGIPCIVSDCVGAKDLIEHRKNGSIFPAGDAKSLAAELAWWREHPQRLTCLYPWEATARKLIELSQLALTAP